MCCIAESDRPALKGADVKRRTPNIGNAAGGSVPLVRGHGWPHKNKHPPHMCYRVKFGRSASKGVCTNRREPQKLWSAGAHPVATGAGLTPGNTPLLYTCYPAECGRSRSNGASVMKEILLNNLTPRVSPFKVTQGHRNWYGSIGSLWLLINVHSNHGPISYRFRDKWRFPSKSQIFPTLCT